MTGGLKTAGRVGAIWLDGQLMAPEQASLPVLSFGLHNAACVFEGIRVYDGVPFKAAEHVDRLLTSANAIGMSLPQTTTEIATAIDASTTAAGYPDAYVRPVAWRGDEVVGIDPTGTSIHLAVAVLRFPTPSPVGGRPVRLGLSRWARPAPTMAPAQAKTSSGYLVGSLALSEAKLGGFDDALLLDHRGYIAEATGANVFVARGGELATPVADTFLNGITRQVVVNLAARAGIPIVATRLTPHDVATADEVFLTGTAVEIQPVGGFLDARYDDDRPVTHALAEDYSSLVRSDRQKEPPWSASA